MTAIGIGYPETAGETGVVNASFPRGDVRRYGAIGDGAVDDTQALRNATTSAIVGGFGCVYLPPGYRFRLTAGLTVTSAIQFYSDASPAGGIADGASAVSATILHEFDGDLFTFNGADGSLPGSGGGIRNLRLVNTAGGAVTSAGQGTAVKLTGIDADHRAAWVRLDNVICENAFGDSWTNFLHIDGVTPGVPIPDLFVRNCSAHIASSSGNAILMEYGSGQFYNCAFYQAGANVKVTGAGGKLSTASNFINCNIAGTFSLDFATDISLVGGIVGAITDTAHTTGTNMLMPGRLVTPFIPTSASATGTLTYNGTTLGHATGSWRPTRAIVAPNNSAVGFHVMNAAGNGTIRAVYVDASDIQYVGLDATDTLFAKPPIALGGGATAAMGTIGGSGPTAAAQAGWLRFRRNDGVIIFLPYWI